LDRVANKLAKVQAQYLTDLNSTAKLVREQVECLERRAKEQTELVQKSFVESMQNLQKTTAKVLETNVVSVTSHVSALSEALATLNKVLQAIGEKQVQVQVPRRGWIRRLFRRN
jgi:DNA-binding winged helix-turn-helix (wHTH) protein